MGIFGSIIGVIIGFVIIKYSVQITDNMGRIQWAEDNLRGGLAGTYTLYRLIGLLIMLFCLLNLFGGAGFLLAPIANLFGGTQ